MLPQCPALDANWREELAPHPCAIVFCWATWSPTDFAFAPILARVVPDLKACAFFTADLDEQSLWPLFAEAAVTTNPCLLLWQKGAVVERTIGYMREEKLRDRFNAWGVL